VKELTPLLLLAALLLLFWLVVLRPARRSQATVAEFQRNLEVGDRVVLSAGIFGTILSIDDQRVQLEIAPGTVIEVARQVVVRRAGDPTPDQPEHEQPDQHAETEPTDGPTEGPTDGPIDPTHRPDAG
jgi:preprotein translocase subunit YajC